MDSGWNRRIAVRRLALANISVAGCFCCAATLNTLTAPNPLWKSRFLLWNEVNSSKLRKQSSQRHQRASSDVKADHSHM